MTYALSDFVDDMRDVDDRNLEETFEKIKTAIREDTHKPLKPNEKLITFLYLLGRDKISLGELEALKDEALEQPVTFYTNQHLEAYSREIAEILTNE